MKVALVGALVVATVSLAQAGQGSTQVLAVVAGDVSSLAVDNARIGWIDTSGVSCRPRIRLLHLSARRTVTLGRRNCKDTQDLVLVHGRAYWTQTAYGNATAYSKVVTATAAHPAGRVLRTWDTNCDFDCPVPDLAEDGRTVVLALDQAIYVVAGVRLRLLVNGVSPGAGVVLGGGNVLVFNRGSPADPVGGVSAYPPKIEVHALADGRPVRTFKVDGGPAVFGLAVSRTRLAVFTDRLRVYDVQSGKRIWEKRVRKPVYAARLPLRLWGRWLLFKTSAKRIDAADVETGRITAITRASGPVTSFDVAAGRVVWAEDLGRLSRVRSLVLPR